MAGEITTPNMNLTLPGVGITAGPLYASDVNASLTIVDAHTHAAGSGVQITPAGLDINTDLSLQSNNLTAARTLRLQPQSSGFSPISADVGCFYVISNDVYFRDVAGNQIRITESGSVAGSAGTITGLPSGTASAAYTPVNGTFVFQQSTNTGANVDIGSLILRYPGSYPTPSGNSISLQVPTTISSAYSITLPTLPSSGVSPVFMKIDSNGNIGNGPSVNAGIAGSNIAEGTISGSNIAAQTITGSNIAGLTITSAQIANATIGNGQIAANTIIGSNIASNTVTFSNLAARTISSSAPLGGVAVSTGSGTSSTNSSSPSGIPNQAVTLITKGSPVIVKMIPTGSPAYLEYTGDVFIEILRDSGIVNTSEFNSGGADLKIGSSIEFVDFVSAGTHVYQFVYYTAGGATLTVSSYMTVVYEI